MLQKKRRINIVASIILLLLPFVAQAKYFLITHDSAAPYWQALFNGANAAAKQFTIELQILSPNGAFDVAQQVQMFENALATHPEGIATTVPADRAFSSALKQAKTKHIPVVAVDAKPASRRGNPYLAFLGSDNLKLGKTIAKFAFKQNKVHQRVIIANPQPGATGLESRAKGIATQLKKYGVNVAKLDVGTDPSRIQQIISADIKTHPQTSAIFCLTSQSLVPIAAYFKNHPELTDSQPAIFSFDNTPETADFIEQGVVTATIAQQPYLMGYFAISELVLKHRYGLAPVDVNTGNSIVSQNNVQKTAALIHDNIR